MRELKAAVVGLGLGRHYVAAFADSPAIGRLLVCDTDRERLAQVAAAYPRVAGVYTDLDAMLERERPDAVAIVTPDPWHRPHVERCAEAGCHLLVTKPLANSLEDGRAIIRAAEAYGRTLMVGHERRFRPSAVRIKELLDSGELGETILVQADRVADRRGAHASAPWKATAEGGRTPMISSAIHEIDLIRHFVRRPITSVSAHRNALGTLEFHGHKTEAALFSFQGGAIGVVSASYEVHWPRQDANTEMTDEFFRLVASRGVILGGRVSRDGRGGWEDLPVDVPRDVSGIRGCVAAFVRALMDGTPAPTPGREAFASMAAAFAVEESAETGRPAVPVSAAF